MVPHFRISWKALLAALALASLPLELRAQVPASPVEETTASNATEAPFAQSTGDELRLIRQLLETQSRQIEVLTQEVSSLRSAMERQIPRAVRAGDSASPLSDSAPPPPDEESAAASMPPAPAPAAAGPSYTVKAGETLTSIARQFNTTVAKLMELNSIADGRKLQIGQMLTLPEPEPQPPSPTETP